MINKIPNESVDQFIERIREDKMTREEFGKKFIVLPCIGNCDYEDCTGWIKIRNDAEHLLDHFDLNTKMSPAPTTITSSDSLPLEDSSSVKQGMIACCSNSDECINGGRYGKGVYEDQLNNAFGGKPWQQCRCGVDSNGEY